MPWNCPKPAARYKLEHEITEADFESRKPVYLTTHSAGYVTGRVAGIADCDFLVGIDPAGNMVPVPAPGLVYYPAGLFKAILEEGTETFEMFATRETEPPHRSDVIMKTNPPGGKPSFYDMSDNDGEDSDDDSDNDDNGNR